MAASPPSKTPRRHRRCAPSLGTVDDDRRAAAGTRQHFGSERASGVAQIERSIMIVMCSTTESVFDVNDVLVARGEPRRRCSSLTAVLSSLGARAQRDVWLTALWVLRAARALRVLGQSSGTFQRTRGGCRPERCRRTHRRYVPNGQRSCLVFVPWRSGCLRP